MKTSEDYYYSVFFSSVDVASLKLNQNFILTTAKKKKITILKLFCILQVHVVQVCYYCYCYYDYDDDDDDVDDNDDYYWLLLLFAVTSTKVTGNTDASASYTAMMNWTDTTLRFLFYLIKTMKKKPFIIDIVAYYLLIYLKLLSCNSSFSDGKISDV